jgi:hypothetical protein
MRKKLCLLGLCAAVAVSQTAEAQSMDAMVSVNGSGLASIQPIDDFYVGPSGPYLDKGLGGIGPGVSVGGNVVAGRRVVLNAEYSSAWLEVDQNGRLVTGGAATGRLHDSMLTAIGGAHLGNGTARVQVLGGVSRLFGTPTSSGVATDRPEESGTVGVRRVVPTAGLDLVHGLGSSISLLLTSRGYFFVDRSERARQLGIGRHIVRVGVGIRIAVGGRPRGSAKALRPWA